jgi:hypothetical protein
MPNATALAAILAAGCAGLAACASAQHPASNTATAGSTTPTTTAHASGPPTATAPVSPNTATSTPACVGLSICPTPPPDAEGNPACYYADGWAASVSGSAIDVYYFHEPRNVSKPDVVTAEIRMKDGTVGSQIAPIDAGQQLHHFEFPSIDKSSVQEVFLISSDGRCYVTGPTGG